MTTLGMFVDTMRRLGIRRLAIDLADNAHTDASKPASVEPPADAPPANAPEPQPRPDAQRKVDLHEAQMLAERDAKRRRAEAQAEHDRYLFAASVGFDPPSIFVEADDAAA
jgi:hypothetical protein